jgi:hypothetical protein
MNRTGRISVGVIIGLISICISASIFFLKSSTAVMDMLISDKPDSVRRVGNSIVDYTLPFGYQEQGSLNLGYSRWPTLRWWIVKLNMMPVSRSC